MLGVTASAAEPVGAGRFKHCITARVTSSSGALGVTRWDSRLPTSAMSSANDVRRARTPLAVWICQYLAVAAAVLQSPS